MMQHWTSVCALILAIVAQVPALEIVGTAPPFLAEPSTPAWRLVPLETVLDEVAKATKATLTRSVSTQQHAQQPVLLVANKAGTLADTLKLLERCAPVRFTVTPGTIAMEDAAEFDAKRYELRIYQLSDYALVAPQRDFPLAPLGIRASEPRRGETFNLFGQSATPATSARDPADIVEYIQRHVAPESWQREGAGIEQRGGSFLYIHNTSEVHAGIHTALTALHDFANRSKRWQVTFGVLPKDERFATGIVTGAQAKAVCGRFTTPDVLTLGGLLGQEIHAQTGSEQSQIVGADVVNYQLDPRPEAVTRGRNVVLRALDGQQQCMVKIRLGWVDDAEPAALSELHSPAHTTPGSSTTTTKTGEAKKDDKTPADVTTELTTSTSLSQDIQGERVRLDLPVLWTWRPEFECFLPRDGALIISTEHPRGQAVMVLEELP